MLYLGNQEVWLKKGETSIDGMLLVDVEDFYLLDSENNYLIDSEDYKLKVGA